MSPKTTMRSVSFDTRLMSLDLHPVSASQTKDQSPARLDSRQMYILHCMTLKIIARQLETAARRLCFAMCAAAQGTLTQPVDGRNPCPSLVDRV